MLIEFSVSNYKSFRERQTLSMVASSRLGKKLNVITTQVPGEKLPNLLKVAAIYGPNASGKSSLLAAMDFVKDLLRQPRRPSDEEKPLTSSFRFDKNLDLEPSCFEYHFIENELRYQYSVHANEKRIVFEELIAYPHGKESLLFTRKHTDTGEKYTFGDNLEGGTQVHEAWRKLTSPRSLFLAQAAIHSSEDMTQLKTPYTWFDNALLVINQNTLSQWSRATRKVLQLMPDTANQLAAFLDDVDIPVTEISTRSLTPEIPSIDKMNADTDFNNIDAKIKTILTHRSALGEANFDFEEESEGTKSLIGFWLPWFTLAAKGKTLSSNLTLVIDELDSSLHPRIVINIIKKHIENSQTSQLIFTTHDTHLMKSKILRRDQFWITERDRYAATRLFSIHDFEGREGEDLERRYFAGRFRGLPLIKEGQ